jgi:rhamnogalacturonyl hydrolase YesR
MGLNRRSFLCGSTALAAVPAIAQAAHETPPQTETQTRIRKAAAAAMAMQRRDWEHGVLAQALLEVNDREAVILLTKGAIVQRTPDGRLGVVVSGSPTDSSMGGEAYAHAAEWTGDPLIRDAVQGLLDWIRNTAPRNASGILYHTFRVPEMWSDGLNCAAPFLAAMGYYDEALVQIEGYRKRLWNPEKRLLAHIWDDGERRFKDENLWGVGNGWAVAGITRVIRRLPQERRDDWERLARFVKEIVDGCLSYQRADGLFHNVVDQPGTFVETNLAQMLAFGVYEGISGGWLPRSYLACADRLRSAAREKMDAFGYVQGVCGAPSFDRPGTATEGQAFCIMMEAAGARVARGSA